MGDGAGPYRIGSRTRPSSGRFEYRAIRSTGDGALRAPPLPVPGELAGLTRPGPPWRRTPSRPLYLSKGRQAGRAHCFGPNSVGPRITAVGFYRSLPGNMTIIMVMKSDTLPLAEIKARLSEIVDRVERHHERITLTRNGRPAAVMISPDDLEALEDTLELLADPRAVAEIERAREEIERGEGLSGEELRSRYIGE